MINKLGNAVLLFADEKTGGHLEGTVIVEGAPGNVVWNLIPIQQKEGGQGSNSGVGKPYRRHAVGFTAKRSA